MSVDGKALSIDKDGIAEDVPAVAVPELVAAFGAKVIEPKPAPTPTPTPTPPAK